MKINKILLLSILFISFQYCIDSNKEDHCYIFYKNVSEISIDKNNIIEEAINSFKDYYKEFMDKENKNKERETISNLEKLEKLANYHLSKLSWHK